MTGRRGRPKGLRYTLRHSTIGHLRSVAQGFSPALPVFGPAIATALRDAARHLRSVAQGFSPALPVVLAAALLAQDAPGRRASILGFTLAAARAERDREAQLAATISADSISAAHRDLTARPHMAGSDGSRVVAEYLRDALATAGLESQTRAYEVYLSTPRRIALEITAPAPERLSVDEPASEADPSTSHPELGPGFVAYSASGTAAAPVVYVNYGLPGDYARLRAAGVEVRGCIVIARYARSHRAVKVHTAEQAGAAGIIIYSDPADDGYAKGDAWPEGPWRHADQVQRGNAKYSWFWHGDPLTPGVAAVAGSAALDPATAPTLPRIPAVAIAWRQAARILSQLRGPAVPAGFQGALPFTYHLGPGPVAVRMRVEMDAGRRTIRNVIARLCGVGQPERLVVLGAHHDAWTFGGVDPGSGTAVVLEVARRLAALRAGGWAPERSVLFAFWDAEEFGLVGSTEFAEERARDLREQAVCYINTDLYMDGRFDGGGVPSLRDFLVQVTRDVPDGSDSVYDAWRAAQWRRQPVERRRRGQTGFEVDLAALGSGADFVAFQDFLGLPTLSIEFDFDGSYGAYHSNYDTRAYMERFGDPGFKRGATLARVLGTAVMRLASAEILPLRYGEYAASIGEFLQTAKGWDADDEGRAIVAMDLSAPERAQAQLLAKAAALDRAIARALDAGRLDGIDLAGLNDALARLEQRLLDESDPPDRRWYRHVIYGWNIYSLYEGQPLPGLAEAIRLKDAARVRIEVARLDAALQRMAAGLDAALTAIGGRK